jgi:hypothetical protein
MHFVGVGLVILLRHHGGDVKALVVGVLDALPQRLQALADRRAEHVRIGVDLLARVRSAGRVDLRIRFVAERVRGHQPTFRLAATLPCW